MVRENIFERIFDTDFDVGPFTDVSRPKSRRGRRKKGTLKPRVRSFKKDTLPITKLGRIIITGSTRTQKERFLALQKKVRDREQEAKFKKKLKNLSKQERDRQVRKLKQLLGRK